jgi:predicted permease
LNFSLKQIIRRLWKAPLFSAVAILTLALGIGANVAIFSLVEGVLLKPLPYPDAASLIALDQSAPGINMDSIGMSPSLYFTYREQNHSFEDLGVTTADSVSVTGLSEPEQVQAQDVTDGVLPLLRVKPVIGRTFSRQDDTAEQPKTIILSYGYWQRKFSGDHSILGRRLMLDGEANEVIGVLPKDFRFLDSNAEIYRPFQFDRKKVVLGNFSYAGVARLKPGITIRQASADVARMLPIANRLFPAPPGFSVRLFESARLAPKLQPLKQQVVGDIGKVLWVLMGTIGVVLLIACANVANLLLVRAEARHQELLVRAALGATRTRLAGDLLGESLTLSFLGGVLGLALAFFALRLLVSVAPAGLPRLHEIGLDAPVLLFAFALCLLTGLLFGSVPVVKHLRGALNIGLREGGRSLSQSRERHRARNALVIAQVALALVLLVGSGLMIRTFLAMTHVDPGFRYPESIQTLEISIPDAQVKDPERVLRMQNDMLQKIQQVPGVRSAGFTTSVPMSGNNSNDVLFARDRAYREGELPPVRRFNFISPGVLQTMGIRLVAGRDLTWSEIYGVAPVILVSENLAKEYWHDARNALHKQVREGMNDPWREVVGVVADVHDNGVDQKVPPAVYWPPILHDFWGDKVSIRRTVAFVVRTPRAGSQNLLGDLRRAIWSVNPNVPVAQVRTLETLYRKSMARTSFTLVILAIASAMALILGIIGIYGVIAYSVSQRTREIGIRMALGAEQKTMTGMFVRDGLRLAGIGAIIGLVAAFGLSRLLSTLLFGVRAADPVTYFTVAFGLLLAAALASYLPSRRAAGIDPAIALRTE